MDKSEGRLIDLPRIADPRGNLTVAEAHSHLPFGVARVYWVYDVPAGECRGGHAHKACREFIVAVSGSFTVTLDDGTVFEVANLLGSAEVIHNVY